MGQKAKLKVGKCESDKRSDQCGKFTQTVFMVKAKINLFVLSKSSGVIDKRVIRQFFGKEQ